MPSPDKLLQLQNVYAISSGKLGAFSTNPSPSRKRRPSGGRQPGASGLSPLPGRKGTSVSCSSLSPKQWKQWMREAHELNVSSSIFLTTTSNESLAQAVVEGLELVLNPAVARMDERLGSLIEDRAANRAESTVGVFATKHSPAASPIQQWRARVTKPRKRRKSTSLRVEPLLSDEMRLKLQAHLEAKIKGNIWENEIRSRLARPLSASTFCDRSEQLRHPLCTVQFVDTVISEPPTLTDPVKDRDEVAHPVVSKFPYSVEAHTFADCIRHCRLKAWFRAALKSRARILAIAIRVLRRRGIPHLIRGFRRRRRAAIRIQRCYRRFQHWCAEVLRPFVCKNVALWVRRALVLTSARIIVARTITALYFARMARREQAAHRKAHLRRWVAKTRVCLFVHQLWTVAWFRGKRSLNVEGMKQELAALESSDHNVHLEYTAIFATPLGKGILKKELTQWRIGAQSRTTQDESTTRKNSVAVDPAVVRLRQCFQIFDLDGSGTLDLDEFQLMLSYLRGKKPQKQAGRGSVSGQKSAPQQPKLTTAQVRNLFAELDYDGNGGITCNEFENWWAREHERTALSTSASTNFLSRGLDGLLLQSHGLLFWLLGRKQQLERKFVKKLMVRRTMESAKREILHLEIDRERVAGVGCGVFRCRSCGRRFGLRRDLDDHVAHDCTSTTVVVDTFMLNRWVHQEEFRLLEDANT